MSNPGVGRRVGADVFQIIPTRAFVVFLGAVFFVFAPVGILLISSFAQTRPLSSTLFIAFLSGALGVCWAGTFTLSRKFIPGIVIFTIGLIFFSGVGRHLPLGAGNARLSVETIGIVLAIALGYTLFVIFISKQGQTTVRLLTEMSLARRIHESLVPRMSFSNERVEALGSSTASSEMGGDLIDRVSTPDSTDLFVADVSGHGVHAGVVMGMIKAMIRSESLGRPTLSTMMGHLNEVLEQTTSAELYATFAALRVDHATGHVEVGLAGHHHVLHYRAKDGTTERLPNNHLPLGMMPDQSHSTSMMSTDRGDLFVIYTDGLNETTNHADEELGHDSIERHVAANGGDPLPALEEKIIALAAAHGPQVDDRTLLLVRMSS